MKALTPVEIKKQVLSKYRIGDIITLRKQNDQGGYSKSPYEVDEIKIIEFHKQCVMCEINNCKECFGYWDILNRPKKIKRKKKNKESGHVGISWHNKNCRWVVNIRVEGKPTYVGIYKELYGAIEAKEEALWKLYKCDPNKNTECTRFGCKYNPTAHHGTCESTRHIEFSI